MSTFNEENTALTVDKDGANGGVFVTEDNARLTQNVSVNLDLSSHYKDLAYQAAQGALTAQEAAELAQALAEAAQALAESAQNSSEAASAVSQANAIASANSASDAATSEANALTYSNLAETAATNASTSAANAASSEGNAAASASNAADSATAAFVSETNAATSEANAATSETNAATSESNAATSATDAATSETNAATSATAAQTAQTAAETAQTAAESAQSATETLFTQFGDQYLGSFATDPTLDNSGNALTTGDIYWNTTDSVLKFYSGTAWVAPETIASTAATNATASASAAATSESNAATSETNAENSAIAAAASELAAINAETGAQGYASDAQAAAVNASASETAAATSESNAATSESNASTSETNAATSETNAATSESNAANSASAAATSEANAAISETNAVNALIDINGIYLGTQTSDPSVDLNGDPLNGGEWYYNTTTSYIRIYTGTEWINGAVDTSSFVVVDSDATLNSLQLNGGTGTQGTLSWNTDEETVDLVLNGATLQLGQEVHYHVRNNTASIIPNGSAVYATGALGASGRITIAPFIADGTIPAKYFIGITTEDIAAGADGKVTDFGKVRNLDTNSFNEGDVLYPSSTVAGGLTNVAPTSPALAIPCAFVVYSGNNGNIFVRVHPQDENAYATYAQGALADSAVQPGDNVSTLTNDASYATTTYVDTAESDAVTSANSYTDTREIAITSAYQSADIVVLNEATSRAMAYAIALG